MKKLAASFNQGLSEGWSMFWAPIMFIARQINKLLTR
jgi:high-affinity Fe2+/Pb2+ permease